MFLQEEKVDISWLHGGCSSLHRKNKMALLNLDGGNFGYFEALREDPWVMDE